MTDKPIVQKIVLGAVIVRDGEILILQRSDNETVLPGMWELPSGKREPLENTEEALIREIKEETDLDVKIEALISVFDYQIEKPDVIKDTVQINFLVECADDSKPILSSEHQDSTWVSQKQLNDYNLSSETKDSIRRAFDLI